MSFNVETCVTSLVYPGHCCVCREARDAQVVATTAVLIEDPASERLVEHAFCDGHARADGILAKKPLVWDPVWGPR